MSCKPELINIVEFNGLPGCGKTTITNKILETSLCCGLPMETYESMFRCLGNNKFSKLLRAIQYFRLIEFCRLLLLARLVCFDKKRTLYKRAIMAELLLIVYRCRRKDRLYIVDQGPLQGILSIAHSYEISDWGKFLSLSQKILAGYKKHVVFVNLVSDSKTARERIRYRNFSYGSRMNFIESDAELEVELQKQHTTLERLRSILPVSQTVTIDAKNEAIVNANTILSFYRGLTECR